MCHVPASMNKATLAQKVATSRRLLDQLFAEFRSPIVASSFGKDSMALLHLARSIRPDIPTVFFRSPFFPRKYTYANRIISDWDLTTHEFPPSACVLQENPQPIPTERIDFVFSYTFGPNASIDAAFGAYDPKPNEPFLCGIRDLLLRPKGGLQQCPWDVLLLGSKTSDSKPQGSLAALQYDLRRTPTISAAFPLRTWTDSDVWEYLEANHVPIDLGRYEKTASGWREHADKSANSDFFPTCTRCMERDAAPIIHCPRLNCDVTNVAASLPWRSAPAVQNFETST